MEGFIPIILSQLETHSINYKCQKRQGNPKSKVLIEIRTPNDRMTSEEKALFDIFALADDCRYLAAFEKYEELLAITSEIDKDSLQQLIEEHGSRFDQLLERVQEIKKALEYEDKGQPWILGNSMFGIHTYYQLDHSDNTIILKLEGVMEDLPLFEQCAVIYEVDLYKEWIPFCSESITVDKLGKAELVPYICLGIPMLLSRDFALHAYGADCLKEHGMVIINGKSIDQYEPKAIPYRPIGWLHNRMEIKEFFSNIHILSPTAAKTVIIAHVNPNAPLPQSLLNYVIKNIAGVLLYLFQKQVIKISKDHHCHHSERIRSNTAFYTNWLLPKLREYCDLQEWEQPTIISLEEQGIPSSPPPKVSSSTVVSTATNTMSSPVNSTVE